ncbi:MAG: tetratricopeptide repeat protein [cyanobacterium endosymbiont of Rhopalodia sterrenbergii]
MKTTFSTNVSSSVIENYIQRVTELSQSSQRIPTMGEVETIATELGIGPDEIEAAQKQSHDHYVRAQGYMRLKHWDDAILELQEAVAFNPSNLEMLISLAGSHMGRWQEKHYHEDENNIRLRIRQCLVIKPDCEEALNLLERFSKALKWRKQVSNGIIVVLGGLTLGISGFFWLNDILPNIFEKKSKLQQLERVFFQNLNELQKEQAVFKAEIFTLQKRNDQRYKADVSKLHSRVNQLERQLATMQRKILEIENPKPNKLTPKSFPYITIP